jgi:hypothetical protein
MEKIRSTVPLVIFPGNHDIGIERFAREAEICPRDGMLIKGIGFLHGHMYPAPELYGNLIVIGHHHPLLALRDEVGCALQEPAYIRAGLMAGKGDLPVPEERALQTRLLFMPAFNELAGYEISRIIKDPFSPLSRCMDAESAEIILADGTYIGPFCALVQDEDD